MNRAEFLKKVTEKRRLAILVFLLDEPEFKMSLELMTLALETYIINVNRDEIAADVDFLRKAGLVTLEYAGALPILALTLSGRETAKGKRRIDGIQKPPLD